MAARKFDRVAMFHARVQRSSGDGCWIWTGARFKVGYGKLIWHGKYAYAHRKSWELEHGPIPAGLCVLHRCDNPLCVRPSHLFLGTRTDNSNDKVSKHRQARGEKTGRLCRSQVRAIRRELGRHRSGNAIARRFGVSRSTVYRIRDGHNWAWLE